MRRSTLLLGFLAVLIVGLLALRLALDEGGGPGKPGGPAANAGPEEPAPKVVDGSEPLEAEGVRREVESPSAPAQASPPAPAGTGAGHLLVVTGDGRTPLAEFALTALLLGPVREGTAGTSVEAPRALLKSVQLTTDGKGRADMTTELAGQAATELVRFFPTADLERRLEPGELSAAALSRSPEQPTVLRAHPRLTSPIAALAVDDETGEPLPNLALRVERWIETSNREAGLKQFLAKGFVVPRRFFAPEKAEWVVTDQAGRLVTERAYPSGRVGFLTIDQERADLQHHALPGGDPVEVRLEVPVGPLIRLDFTPGGSRTHDDYVAGLWRAPRELLHDDGVDEQPSPWSPCGGSNAGLWGDAVPVHGGAPPWLRIPVEQEQEPLPSMLFLISRDGASFGYSPIDSFERHRSDPLQVTLTEYLALDITLVWPVETGGEGARLNGDSTAVTLEALGPGEHSGHSRRVIRMHGRPRTNVQFQVLTPGTYRLSVPASAFHPLEREVTVPARNPIVIELQRRAVEIIAGVEATGHVLTASGLPLDGGGGRAHLSSLYLSPVDPGMTRTLRAQVTWKEGVGSFRFEQVPPGGYRLRLDWYEGFFVVEPEEMLVKIPGPIPAIRVADNGPAVRLEVRVLEPLSRGYIIVRTSLGDSLIGGSGYSFEPEDAPTVLPDGRRAQVLLVGPFNPEAKFKVEFLAEGYRPTTLKDDELPPPDGNGLRVVEITARRGWVAKFTVYAVNEEGGPTDRVLPGIVLTVDGLEQLPSDDSGLVLVEADRKPAHLGVATPGWRLVTRTSWDDWGSVFAPSGTFTVESGFLDVFLIPTQR
jgi:hypothetical protein